MSNNELIAEMLGFTQKSYELNPKPEDLMWCDPIHGLPVGELKFDSDYNWLMKAVTHLTNLGLVFLYKKNKYELYTEDMELITHSYSLYDLIIKYIRFVSKETYP